MAEDTWKADEHSTAPGGPVYKQVAPAGLAAELTAADPVAPETVTALARWLTKALAGDPSRRDQIAALSGLSVSELTSLMDGHPLFRLDTDHLQRIATALVEAQVIPQADELWNALGSEAGASDYIVPPARIVRGMSGGS